MQNIFSKSYWNRLVPWNKKLSWLCFLSTLTLFSFTMMLVTPAIFSDHHGDDGDSREEAAGILGGAGVLIGAGAKAAGAIIVGTGVAVTAPAWVPIATGVGIGLGAAGAGIALWDLLDGPEDDCNDCDGSGYYMGDNCNTCNPGDYTFR